jgi:2-oxo-4-hydroxy-4-carboxy--5-ureidoimidazoline (OHCU) decarboxylase
MELHSFEGTWEEILRHAPELAGQRVRLTVLPDESSNHQNEVTLDQALKDRVGRVQFQPSNLSTRTKEAFTDLLVEKYMLPGSGQ